MANDIYRDRIINDINHAIAEARSAALIEHPGLTGRIRELVAERLLSPLLPAGFSLGSGKIVDCWGAQSGETDLIIYNKAILPPILYGERDGAFPVEACYYAIEVKSKLTAAAVRDSIEKGRRILNLKWNGRPEGYVSNVAPVVLLLFALDSDLAAASAEIDRYRQLDPNWASDPVLKAICVVGRGYWYHKPSASGWMGSAATADHDEVIDFIAGTANTLRLNPESLRLALLGHYLSLDNRPATLTRVGDS